MNYKRKVLSFVIINSLVFLSILTPVVVVDPLFIFRKPDMSKQYKWFYYGIGLNRVMIDLIKNTNLYDSVMLTNSHFAQTDLTEFPSCLKLIAGTPNVMDYSLLLKKLCSNEKNHKLHKHVKKVYWGLELWDAYVPFVRHIYFPDFDKLFLESVKYTFVSLFLSKQKNGRFRYSDTLAKWYYYWDGDVVQAYQKTFYKEKHALDLSLFFCENTPQKFAFFDEFVIPYVRENPGVEFHFLIVPYSVLEFVKKSLNGRGGWLVMYQKYIIDVLSKFKNVTIYGFGDCKFVRNLANYWDPSHYQPEINQFMLYCIKHKLHIVNNDTNYTERVVENIKNFLRNYKTIRKETLMAPHMDSLGELIKQDELQ